jgi:hypothetical protein
MSVLSDLLGLGLDPKDLTLAHVLVRTFVFFYVLALLRVAKRRFLAQKDPLDILLAFLLASMISRAINGAAPFVTSLGSGLLLVLMHRVLTRLSYASPSSSDSSRAAPMSWSEMARFSGTHSPTTRSARRTLLPICGSRRTRAIPGP